MPDTLTIDLDELVDDLTLGEVEDIEAITGRSISHVISKAGITGTAVLALVFVLKRRKDPAYTLDQARALRFADVDLATVAAEANGGRPGPTPAAS